MCVYVCVYVPAGFPATAYGPVAAAAVAAARGSGRGARGRGGYLAYPQSTGPGKRSVHVLCGCCSLQLLLLCFPDRRRTPSFYATLADSFSVDSQIYIHITLSNIIKYICTLIMSSLKGSSSEV